MRFQKYDGSESDWLNDCSRVNWFLIVRNHTRPASPWPYNGVIIFHTMGTLVAGSTTRKPRGGRAYTGARVDLLLAVSARSASEHQSRVSHGDALDDRRPAVALRVLGAALRASATVFQLASTSPHSCILDERALQRPSAQREPVLVHIGKMMR